MRYFFILTISLLFLMACKKPPVYDEIPSIAFERFLVDSIERCFGQTSLVISFTDGDGDIGNPEGDTTTYLFVYDPRFDAIIEYQIPFIAKEGLGDGISGEIEVDMSNIPCKLPGSFDLCPNQAGTYDEVQYEVYLKDRAGNKSNTIQTDPLTIRCFQ